ncbi:MAG: DUF1127 domain-containing protein [Propylenella sp.]
MKTIKGTNMSTIDTLRAGSRTAAQFGTGLGGLLACVEAMMQRHCSRRLLLSMTDEQLKDIGISRADAYREARRPFWD